MRLLNSNRCPFEFDEEWLTANRRPVLDHLDELNIKIVNLGKAVNFPFTLRFLVPHHVLTIEVEILLWKLFGSTFTPSVVESYPEHVKYALLEESNPRLRTFVMSIEQFWGPLKFIRL